MTEETAYRTHTCGALRKEHAGGHVQLTGWVHTRRDHKNILFLDLRDRYGITQLVLLPSTVREQGAEEIHDEDVLLIEGDVAIRPASLVNPHLATGEVEVQVSRVEKLSGAKTPPFEIAQDGEVGEDVRLRYRYLDLRREGMKNAMILRDAFIGGIRSSLREEGFLEIETPILTKSTPEGARDYIVPSRVHPGKWYALPQSPQQYKQLLMVAGMDRYFQIARCFRDEDQRGDRQPEFTQLDIEMSFVDRENVMSLLEKTYTSVLTSLNIPLAKTPFPRMTYKEAMDTYGTDRPDIRTEEEKASGKLAFTWVVDFPLFEQALEDGHYAPSHHMFTAPVPEDIELLGKDPFRVRSQQYDLVCNGYEVAGGSIRIHTPALQETIFRLVGFNTEKAQEQFGHMLEAFEYGVPPHGGIASGLDRMLMAMTGVSTIRDVMAFPKNQQAEDVLFHAPSPVEPGQLRDLHLQPPSRS